MVFFYRTSKEIWHCFGFIHYALCLVEKNSRHLFNQSDYKPKQLGRARFPALGGATSPHWFILFLKTILRSHTIRENLYVDNGFKSFDKCLAWKEHSIPVSIHTSEAVRMLTPENVSFSVKENGLSLEFLSSYPSPSFAVFWNRPKRSRPKCIARHDPRW